MWPSWGRLGTCGGRRCMRNLYLLLKFSVHLNFSKNSLFFFKKKTSLVSHNFSQFLLIFSASLSSTTFTMRGLFNTFTVSPLRCQLPRPGQNPLLYLFLIIWNQIRLISTPVTSNVFRWGFKPNIWVRLDSSIFLTPLPACISEASSVGSTFKTQPQSSRCSPAVASGCTTVTSVDRCSNLSTFLLCPQPSGSFPPTQNKVLNLWPRWQILKWSSLGLLFQPASLSCSQAHLVTPVWVCLLFLGHQSTPGSGGLFPHIVTWFAPSFPPVLHPVSSPQGGLFQTFPPQRAFFPSHPH